MQPEPTNNRSRRIRDYVLYFAISFAVCGVTIFLGLSHIEHDKLMKWVFAICYTAFTFGFVIEQNKQLLRRKAFWLITASALVVHCVAIALALPHIHQTKGAWWVVFVLEAVVFSNFIRWLLRSTPSPS
jgi:hypothetical protein